jgi:hypothetical protein
MRVTKVRIVFETGELGGGLPLTMTGELDLHADGSITGTGVLFGPGIAGHFAATGSFESIAPASQPLPNASA